MTAADFMPIIQSLIAGAALMMTALIGIYVPRAIAAFERRTGVVLTDQQRAAVRAAADTQAGIVETMLQTGAMRLTDVRPESPVMIAHAKEALSRVPDSAAAQGTTPAAMAAIIVGRAATAPPAATTLVVANDLSPSGRKA